MIRRIIHISFGLLNGGKENMMVDIANEQKSLGYQVAIVIINNTIEKSILKRISYGILVFKLNRRARSINPIPFLVLFNILNFIFKPDVLHCHSSDLGRILKFISKAKRVLTIHGPGISTRYMNAFHKLFAISKSVKFDIEKRSQYKCTLVYNGICTDKIKRKDNYDKRIIFEIVHVKRLNHERKGQDLLILATKKIVHDYGINNLRVHLIGEGESRLFLQRQIVELGLENVIILEGNKNREWVYKHLSDYDLFVHPSRYEGFGLVVTEAMAAKVPVLVSDIDGPAEIVANGKYGFLFENGNIDDLALKIVNIMMLYDSGQIASFIELAYQRCLSDFDINSTATTYCLNYPTK